MAQARGTFASTKTIRAMFEIVISLGLYAGALFLLVKGAFDFCNIHHDNVVTEP